MFTLGGAAASASATDGATYQANTAGMLTTALNSAVDGDTIQLTGSIDEGTGVRLTVQKSITLDLNGNALTVGLIAMPFGDNSLDIESSAPGGTLTADATGLPVNQTGPGIQVVAGESLTIGGGTVDATGGNGYPGIGATPGRTSGEITINDGSVTANGGNLAAGIGGVEGEGPDGSAGGNSGPITITDGTVVANGGAAGIGSGFDANAGPITISGGDVTANGGDRSAGIGGGENGGTGDITISGGVVHANGGQHGAGIGSGGANTDAMSTGTISITAGTVVATTGVIPNIENDASAIGGGYNTNVGDISITGGTVTANTSGTTAAAIGGVPGMSVGDITISGAGTVVTASNASGAPVVGGGAGSSATGDILIGSGADVTLSQTNPSVDQSVLDATGSSLEVAGTVHLPADNYLAIPSGRVVTVDGSGEVTGHGSVVGSGELDNGGVLDVDAIADAKTDGTLNVTGNDYDVTFSPSSPNSGATNTTSATRIYAPSFDALGRALPTKADQQAEIFGGWSATQGGASNFTTTTTVTTDETVYGVWNPVTSLQVTPVHSAVSASGSTAFTVTGVDAANDHSEQTTYARFTSDVPSDSFSNATATGTFHKSGDRIVTATVPSLSGGTDATGNTFVTVNASAMTGFALTPGDVTVQADYTADFDVTGLDADGNSTGDITPSATFTSSQSGDVFTGSHHSEVLLTKAGVHVITATVGVQTQSSTITVTPAPLDVLSFAGAPATITAGSTVDFDVQGADGFGNALGDKTSESSLDLIDRDSQAGESVNGNAVTFVHAGQRMISIRDGAVNSTITVDVVHAAATTFRFTTPRATAYPGVAYSFGLSTSDAYGNLIAAANTKAKSSVSSDHVSGSHVTFSKLGRHTVTATTGSHKFTETVTVGKDGVYLVMGVQPFITAGARATVNVLAVAGASGVRPAGTVRVYYGKKYVSAKLKSSSNPADSGVATVKLPALTFAGNYTIRVDYLGSTTYGPTNVQQDLDVEAGDDTRIAFDHLNTAMVLGPQTLVIDETDNYGNVLGLDTAPVVLTASGGGYIATGSTITFTKLGKHTITARSHGRTVTGKVTVRNDSVDVSIVPFLTFSTTAPTSVTVFASPSKSVGVQVTGSVTLHWGTKSAKVKLAPAGGGAGVATFSVPALKAGSYKVYATYPGAYGFYTGKSSSTTVRSEPR